MPQETNTEDTGWYPENFVNPADDPAIDWIVPATDDDPVPPEDRLAEEPESVEADPDDDPNANLAPDLRGEASFPASEDGEAGPRKFVQPVFAGLNLSDYSRNAQQKGWGAPCTAARATVRLSQAAVTVDARLAELVGLLMRACEDREYIFRKADTGAYNCRKISGTNTWSNHAWGIAVDVNWQSNPYTTAWSTDIPDWMHNLWNRFGFAWGGDYTGGKRDFMHFEFMGTPQQAVVSLVLARAELSGAPAIQTGQIQIGDRDMKVIAAPNRGAALVGAGYFYQLKDEEDAQQAQNLWGPTVQGNARQFDLWKAQAMYGIATPPPTK